MRQRTDSASVYKTFARATGIMHRAINLQQGKHVLNRAFHIQNVNTYDSRLKTWIRQFNGVATRYFDNYLGWDRLLECYRERISPALCRSEAVHR